MENNQASYRHDLGKGLYLDSYSIDPNIGESELVKIVSSKDGSADPALELPAPHIYLIDHLSSFGELKVDVVDTLYAVPPVLQPYRAALGVKLDSMTYPNGKKKYHNGNIAVVDSPVKMPIRLHKGGYYDFKATQLDAVPGDLLPDVYPASKTLEELMPEYEITNNQRARYLCLAFIMLPNNGKEVSLVQRAKDLGIAADCMAVSGGTPPFREDFLRQGFNFQEFYEDQIAEEMKEEYSLQGDEFNITCMYVLEDERILPHVAVEIVTPLTTRELAQRNYGNKKTIEEHPVLYGMKTEAINTLIARFNQLPSVAYFLHLFDRDKKSKYPVT